MATKVEEGIKNYFKLKAKYKKKYNSAIKNIRENSKSNRRAGGIARKVCSLEACRTNCAMPLTIILTVFYVKCHYVFFKLLNCFWAVRRSKIPCFLQ